MSVIGTQLIVNGNSYDAALIASRPIYDPNTGLYWERVYEGTQASITALASVIGLSDDERWDIDNSQLPLARLTIRTPDYSDGQTSSRAKWELIHNKVEKDIFEFHKATALGDVIIGKIRKDIKNENQNELSVTNLSTKPDAISLYFAALQKQNKFLTYEYVLRYELVASNRYGVWAAFSNLERLFTQAQLLNPSIAGFTIPAATQVAIANIPSKADVTMPLTLGTPPTTVTDYFVWSWLKQPADIEQLPAGKLVVRQEFWLDLWPTWVYANAA